MWGQLSTTCSNVPKQPKWELLVAVNHNQLRTMASETVDPIHWSHPLPSWAVPPERLVHSINQCNLSGNRTCNRSMRGNHFANAATQGMNIDTDVFWRWFPPRCRELTGELTGELIRTRGLTITSVRGNGTYEIAVNIWIW